MSQASAPSTFYPHPNSPIGNIASLHNKVALITGGSSGLGRAIALAYAAAGAYVVSADLKPTPPHSPVIEETLKGVDLKTPTVDLVNAGFPSEREGLPRAAYVETDVTVEDSIKAAVKFTVDTFGRLDIMVNNAGISAESNQRTEAGTLQNRLHETDVSVLDQSLAVNVRGVWLGTKHAVRQFLAQDPLTPNARDRGWIVNLASVLASVGLVGATSYSTSKGAVLQLTRASALEYARDGIHVNAIQPGFTDTHLLEQLYSRTPGGKAAIDQVLNVAHPWGRTGRAEDVARVAVFLAGEGAGWITGTGVVVDGGYLAQ